MTLPLVTFGIVNCNRLFYLKSCFESLLRTTKSYKKIEVIVVDNASIEVGTKEYLDQIEKLENVRVYRKKDRDPSNEFAKALNIICRESKGEIIIPLQGDMQFVIDNWLNDYIEIFQRHKDQVGCIALDAQRNVTNQREAGGMSQPITSTNNAFVANAYRPPISGCGDVAYSREIIDLIYPWNENNVNHEGGNDSETSMLSKVKDILGNVDKNYYMFAPIISPAVGIYTDARGTQGRVRGNKRYGDYWPPKDETGNFYYEISDIASMKEHLVSRLVPMGIEELASPIGWEAPINKFTNEWLKNPIRPDSASESDYVVLYNDLVLNEEKHETIDYLTDWLQS